MSGLAAEHFVYLHDCLSVHLALLFTCILLLTHGYMPDAFIKSSITPILLNKNGDTSANTTTLQM